MTVGKHHTEDCVPLLTNTYRQGAGCLFVAQSLGPSYPSRPLTPLEPMPPANLGGLLHVPVCAGNSQPLYAKRDPSHEPWMPGRNDPSVFAARHWYEYHDGQSRMVERTACRALRLEEGELGDSLPSSAPFLPGPFGWVRVPTDVPPYLRGRLRASPVHQISIHLCAESPLVYGSAPDYAA